MSEACELEPKKKRGRKPKEKGYFLSEQEEAFKEFLVCENERQRNKIFNAKIYPALCKMIECLIHRYDLFTLDETYEDTFHDTMSFLISKINNFDPNKNCKAYSYCGTVCKNYLILRRTQSIKRRDKFLSYEMFYPNPDNDERIDEVNEDENFHDDLIKRTKKEIIDLLDYGKYKNRALTENEIKVGGALLEILDNWETIIDDSTSRKFNKVSLNYFIKEYTMCSSTDVRNAMKVFKNIYLFSKEEMLRE